MTTVDNHHIVNSHSSVGAIQVTAQDTSIKSEGGKVVVDEEIDSCEGEDYDEKKMFQVALVNSVMDTGGNANGNSMAQQEAPGEMSPRSKARYALRKRRRPGQEAGAALHMDIVGSNQPDVFTDFLDIPNDPLNELQHVQDNSGVGSMSLPPIQLPLPAPSHTNININQESQQELSAGVTAEGLPQPGIISKPPSTFPPVLLPSVLVPIPQQNRQHQSTMKSNLVYSTKPSGAKKKAPRKRKPKTQKITAKTKVAERLSIPVPNPLLAASTQPTHSSMNHCARQDAAVTQTSSVPCPLPVLSPLDVGSSIQVKGPNKATYIPPFDPTLLTKVSDSSVSRMDPPPIQTRTRVFSVDLDRKLFNLTSH